MHTTTTTSDPHWSYTHSQCTTFSHWHFFPAFDSQGLIGLRFQQGPTLAPWHPRRCFHALMASPKPALNKAGLRTSPCLTPDWLCKGVVSFHTATLRIIKRSQQLNVFFRKPLSVECCKQNWKISNRFVKCLFPAIVRSRTQKQAMHVQRPCQVWSQIELIKVQQKSR